MSDFSSFRPPGRALVASAAATALTMTAPKPWDEIFGLVLLAAVLALLSSIVSFWMAANRSRLFPRSTIDIDTTFEYEATVLGVSAVIHLATAALTRVVGQDWAHLARENALFSTGQLIIAIVQVAFVVYGLLAERRRKKNQEKGE